MSTQSQGGIQAQRERLWAGTAPYAGDPEDHPVMDYYLVPGASSAVLVCPGGGYQGLAPHEGEPVARMLNAAGISSAVVYYRLAPRHKHPAMLHDAVRALKMLRGYAERVGILGFSAGGHLAASACTMYGDVRMDDEIDRRHGRPDAAVLVYGVLGFQPWLGHGGSRRNLLGGVFDTKLAKDVDPTLRVSGDTPPAFLVHTMEDPAVPCELSLEYARALRKHAVAFDLHIFQRGKHGLGLGSGDPCFSAWPDLCVRWLRGQGFGTPQTA